MRWLIVVVVAGGCGRVGFDDRAGSPSGDGSVDAAADASPCGWSALGFDACALTFPSSGLTLAIATVDTSAETISGEVIGPFTPVVIAQPGGTPALLVVVQSLSVTGTVTIVGARPVIFASNTTIDVSGSIDAGGLGGGVLALGSRPDVRAGCPGANGGAIGFGVGGAGGGGVSLAARDSITIHPSASVASGGAGGQTGGQTGSKGGGGGGGSGGMIVLDAASITVSGATLAANGGGGGPGGDNPGTNGQDGLPSATPAAGGIHQQGATDGGTGGALIVPAGQSAAASQEGGGAGGGGVGFVLLRGTATTTGATISPAATKL